MTCIIAITTEAPRFKVLLCISDYFNNISLVIIRWKQIPRQIFIADWCIFSYYDLHVYQKLPSLFKDPKIDVPISSPEVVKLIVHRTTAI